MYEKFLIIVIVLVLSFGGSVIAAELKVIRVGTGDGTVVGSDIDCGPFCQATYTPKTIVQLKAIPDDGSTFVGWMVNGRTHQGAIVIDQEDILVAAKFERNLNLDETTVMWYEGNIKQYATIALDQLIVFPDVTDTWDLDTPGGYEAELNEIAIRLHPQAKLTNDPYFKWVESPEPLTLEQLEQSITAILKLKYVRQVSPLLYFYQGDHPWMILTGEITVKYPKSYTEAQIHLIEHTYHLTRIRFEKSDPFSRYFYQTEGDALHAIEVANQLYESGLAEYAAPGFIIEALTGQAPPAPNTDPYFQDQWQFIEQDVGDIQSVWNQYKGEGVTIAILDDGVDYLHEDLQDNLNLQGSYNYFDHRFALIDNSPTLEYYLSNVCPPNTPDIVTCKAFNVSELKKLLRLSVSYFR